MRLIIEIPENLQVTRLKAALAALGLVCRYGRDGDLRAGADPARAAGAGQSAAGAGRRT